MTGKERMRAVLRKQPTDRLPWTTIVDNTTLDRLPPELRGHCGLDFYRHIGCDIFLLDSWSTPHGFRSPELHWSPGTTVDSRKDGTRNITTWQTPKGTLTAIHDRGHPVKYPVDSIEAVRVLRWMWEGARFTGQDERATFASIESMLGQDGVMTRFWGPSTIPRLLEQDMGTEKFYYLMADHPAEMDRLIRTIHERELEAFRILADDPWESVTLVENTVTV